MTAREKGKGEREKGKGESEKHENRCTGRVPCFLMDKQ